MASRAPTMPSPSTARAMPIIISGTLALGAETAGTGVGVTVGVAVRVGTGVTVAAGVSVRLG